MRSTTSVDKSEGDARHLLTVLEVAHALAVERATGHISLEDAEAALALRSVNYGDDEHYDIVSAFIKSIRGSDPDAGVYWLARMLEAGEDARFIARRLVILASEDIGPADPASLLVLGLPRRTQSSTSGFRRRRSTRCGTRSCTSSLVSKSNSVVSALGAASAAVRDRRAGPVPMHLRDSHYRGAQALGHGEGYVYPHDVPQGWVPQDYRPAEVAGETFYAPRPHGAEPGMLAAGSAPAGDRSNDRTRREQVTIFVGRWRRAVGDRRHRRRDARRGAGRDAGRRHAHIARLPRQHANAAA